MTGGSHVYDVDEVWPNSQRAIAAARHIAVTCGTDPCLRLNWATSRLDAVEQVRPLLVTASGDACFQVGPDPGPLLAMLDQAGLARSLSRSGDGWSIDVFYRRIVDALDHACLATTTTLEIEIGYELGDDWKPAFEPDEVTLDHLVAVAADDMFGAYWSCRWFGSDTHSYCGVEVDLNGDRITLDGHRPGHHQVTVSINYRLDSPHEIAARIAAVSGRRLVYLGTD
jgi:hypothetical protein